MSRSYEQTCFVARALDVVGERWTLLIVRELAFGPRRYSDLLDSLPGIGTSLLATRLKHLEQYGVLRRTVLPGPGRSAAYELGDRGVALVPVLASLCDWGAGLETAPPGYGDRATLAMLAMRLTAPAEAAAFDTVTELHVGEETLWVQGDGKQVRVEAGPAPVKPGLRLTCAKETFYAVTRGEVPLGEPLASGELALEGDPDTARRFFQLFRMPDGPSAGDADHLKKRNAPS